MTISTLFRSFSVGCIALALAGCATNREVATDPSFEVVNLDTLPAPTTVAGYRIGPMQSLEVTVAGANDLTGTFLTDETGALDFPLTGPIALAGKTPNEAARIVADRLRGDFLVNPQVRIRPMDIPSPTVSIGGEVKTPGSYPAITSTTLLRAVNNAGGLSEYAKKEDILVLRKVADRNYIGVYNIRAIQRGNYPDPAIYPNDIITVGDSPERRRLETILQFFPVLSSALLLVDRAAAN